MRSLAKKYDESKLSARVAILTGLVTFQLADGLLSLEALRTSPLAQSYAAALAVMGLGVLVFALQKLRSYLSEPTPIAEPRTGPVWHEARLFTDPWYQIPAIYCVFVLLCQLVIDLAGNPPASVQAVLFLVCVAAMSVVVPASASKRVSLEKTHLQASSEEERDAAPKPASAFRDPWFVVPGAVLGAVEMARFGLESIEADPSSGEATWWLLAPLLTMAFAAAMPLVDQYRRRRKEAAETDALPPGLPDQ
ncbi:MAG: hypothetical protein F4080_06440 [Holophagales bacterium]|nr:hypothetical protein [Holophagales bacterium]